MAPKKNKKLPTTDEGKFNSYKHNIKRKYELINEFIDYKIVNVANYKPDEDSNYQDTININKIGKDSLSTSGTQSTVNKEKKFYAKPNDSTQNIEKCDFMEFLSKLCDNPEVMLKTKNVTVNGLLVMDSNYELKSGDVVRVGKGHYINGSKQTAIVK